MLTARPDLYRLVCPCCCVAISIAGGWFYPRAAMADEPIAVDSVVVPDAAPDQFEWRAAEDPAPPGEPAEPEAAARQSPGYNWRGPPPTQPDWSGVRRDVAYFLGYQFVAVAALYVAPESVSGWDSEAKHDFTLDKWRANVAKPVWDEDTWWINYVTHPYWGGTYYIQARERGLGRAQSFWYSALISTLYEYGAEALAEPVSIQDLVVTPAAGFLVGEYLFTPLRKRIRAQAGELDWSDKTLLFITDPLGVISTKVDRLLGVKTTLQWQPIGMQALAVGIDHSDGSAPAYPRGAVPVWGLQVRVDW